MNMNIPLHSSAKASHYNVVLMAVDFMKQKLSEY